MCVTVRGSSAVQGYSSLSAAKCTTRSTCPRLSSEWFAEIELVAAMNELDYSGFIFDRNQLDIVKPWDSKIVKGIMKIVSTDVKRKIC